MAATRRNRAGKGHRSAGPADPDHTLFQRLAQGLEHADGKLPHLVEEEDTVGGQADLPGPERPAAPADQGHDRRAVVRGPKGWLADQHPVGEETAGRRVHPGHRRATPPSVSAGNSPGRRSASMVFPEPGGPTMSRWCRPAAATSRAWRPKGCPLTSARSGSCGGAGGLSTGGVAGHVAPGRAGSAPARPARTRRGRRRPGPGPPLGRRTTARPAPAERWRPPGRSCPGHGADEPFRPSSPQKVEPLGAARRELARGHQHPHGDGQVESGARLCARPMGPSSR